MEAALQSAHLPTQDIRDPGKLFYGAEKAGETVGFIGFEVQGSEALLRSVVARQRGQGSGVLLVQAAIEQARIEGVRRLWLLTTTARDFFLKQGFRKVERSAAPDAIRQTQEFQSLCPAEADCMTFEIEEC
ncbi:arsenic resistance N-acetyltransferase ArsN2 [Allosphingosinicella vermicomposti]|uniref:arsenic resistance N-acetyltransferase ArsN2 n=1 Tax=Allosphingosinicella vermicomposti TaxID=614671 RepID=UPI00131A4FCC|nr:arsenic resistance N-acetyltransferase ArsN2 [Allosphingosinicella vermicomposti]